MYLRAERDLYAPFGLNATHVLLPVECGFSESY